MGEQMRTREASETAIKQLEREVAFLETQQTELIRKKWALEDKIRKQQELIERFQFEGQEAKNSLSVWKKVALMFAVAWGLVLSFFNIDRK